ncbi:MAG: CrcB family protein [Arachnia sp.]
MIVFLLTGLAGGLGGVARFLVDTAVSRRNPFRLPLGTVVVNATACLLLGLLTGYAVTHTGSDALRSILGVGLLGGYSTFSTASVEGARLVRQQRVLAALAHAGGMLVVSLGASLGGLALGGLIG